MPRLLCDKCAQRNKGYRYVQRKKEMVALTIYLWTIYKWNTTVPCTELPSWTTCIMIPPVASATTGIQNMDTKQACLRSARLRSSSSGCPGLLCKTRNMQVMSASCTTKINPKNYGCQGCLFDPWSLWPWDRHGDRDMDREEAHICTLWQSSIEITAYQRTTPMVPPTHFSELEW